MSEIYEKATAVVPLVPTEEQWSGLARHIMMWLDFGPRHTPESLFKHLGRCGCEIPQWLRDEGEMKHLDHAISKGTRCAIIYRAMVEAAPPAVNSIEALEARVRELERALREIRKYAFHHLHCDRNKLENGPHGLRHMKCNCGWDEADEIAASLAGTPSSTAEG